MENKNIEFYPTILEEQETLLNVIYAEKIVKIYTSKKSIYIRLYKNIGKPNKVYRIKDSVCGGEWIIPFSDRATLRKVLSLTTLIGQMGLV